MFLFLDPSWTVLLLSHLELWCHVLCYEVREPDGLELDLVSRGVNQYIGSVVKVKSITIVSVVTISSVEIWISSLDLAHEPLVQDVVDPKVPLSKFLCSLSSQSGLSALVVLGIWRIKHADGVHILFCKRKSTAILSLKEVFKSTSFEMLLSGVSENTLVPVQVGF